MTDSTSLEEQVIEMLLAGSDESLALLRQQASQARVSSRKMTGVGFFSHFIIPAGTTRVMGHPTFYLGDVNGTAAHVKHGLGFVLFVTKGTLSMLEGYTFDEPWPDEIQGLTLTYSGGQGRNIDELRKSIQRRQDALTVS